MGRLLDDLEDDRFSVVIAKRLVEIPTQRYGGALPIVLPDDISGDAERHYKGYDLGSIGERLRELSEVIDGPEIEFRPEWADATHSAIQWRMRIGNPNLGDTTGYPHAWDYGAALIRVSVDRDASRQTFARFERGAGSERQLVYGHYQDLTLINAGWPLPEDQGGEHISASVKSTLDGWAKKYVTTYYRPTISWDITVRAAGDDGQGHPTRSPSLDLLAAGDTGVANVHGHRVITDGTYPIRILGASNGDDPHTAKLTLQPLQGA
ncbi:hypothetical protein [Amycolatopsis minnesotensis]|uniref:Uncharacterized protein n=1 Tax=Amycolatopsis minnesotensis TaxID=337894 RepID=A0ABN2RJS5_9PSEU